MNDDDMRNPPNPESDETIMPNATTAELAASTVERHIEELLGGPAVYTVAQAADMADLTEEQVTWFWGDLGFPTIREPETDTLFTEGDITAMRIHGELLKSENLPTGMSLDPLRALTRGESQAMDRLVLWQQDALLKYAEGTLGLDSISARFWLLDHIGDYEDFLQMQMIYAWKRHLAAHLRRTEVEWTAMPTEAAGNTHINRAVGFIDLVSFTMRSNELDHHELIELIETFDRVCRDTITSKGARVVKTIGDAFLYVADTIDIAADVTTAIVERLRAVDGMLPIRASVVWGPIVSRFGDIFGPSVNLASRLASEAMPNTVLTDEKTSGIIRTLRLGYATTDLGRRDLKGIGETRVLELRRMPGA